MPDETGKDSQTTAALQRRHQAYEQELIALGQQVTTPVSEICQFDKTFYTGQVYVPYCEFVIFC